MIYKTKPVGEEFLYDERCEGWVDYSEFRTYDKLTNTVYETQIIASKVTGIPINKIQNDIRYSVKRWNRIGNAFYDRKYNYYKCPENFTSNMTRKKKSEE